jgi:hypothetical protein
MPCTAERGKVTIGSQGIPGRICSTGGRFQIIQGVNEQQDFLKRIEYHNGDRCPVQSPARDSRREIFAITGILLRELQEIQ